MLCIALAFNQILERRSKFISSERDDVATTISGLLGEFDLKSML